MSGLEKTTSAPGHWMPEGTDPRNLSPYQRWTRWSVMAGRIATARAATWNATTKPYGIVALPGPQVTALNTATPVYDTMIAARPGQWRLKGYAGGHSGEVDTQGVEAYQDFAHDVLGVGQEPASPPVPELTVEQLNLIVKKLKQLDVAA